MYHKFKPYPNSLRRHRKAAGLRQHEVARALGLNTTERISKWENGHSIPRGRTLLQLATLYHVPPRQLFTEVYQSSPAVERTSEPRGFIMVPSLHPDGTGPFWKEGPVRQPIVTSPSTDAAASEGRTREGECTPDSRPASNPPK
jgi:transcriptional regulator with XRE-family HTH domain